MLKSHKARKKGPRTPKSKVFTNMKKVKPPAWDGVCRDHRGIEKRRYLDEQVARKAALGLMLGADPTKGDRSTINAYHCERCGCFHLGHGRKS